jgi:hypothetical protein
LAQINDANRGSEKDLQTFFACYEEAKAKTNPVSSVGKVDTITK